MYRKPSKPPEKRPCPHCGSPYDHPFCEGYGAVEGKKEALYQPQEHGNWKDVTDWEGIGQAILALCFFTAAVIAVVALFLL